jgi:hypothetical protein
LPWHIPDDLKKQILSKKSAFDKIAAKEVKARAFVNDILAKARPTIS